MRSTEYPHGSDGPSLTGLSSTSQRPKSALHQNLCRHSSGDPTRTKPRSSPNHFTLSPTAWSPLMIMLTTDTHIDSVPPIAHSNYSSL